MSTTKMDVMDYDDAVSAINVNGRKPKSGKRVTYLLMGNPGVGKTSIMEDLKTLNPTHEEAMIDCANLDLGDLLMPYMDKEIGATRYLPNVHFGFHKKKPLIVGLDEFTKAQQSVQNMLLPLILEDRIGDLHLMEDSILFATGNSIELNLGDKLKSHVRNRVITIKFRCPTATKWISYAAKNNAHPLMIAYVHETPDVMKEYTDAGQSKNSRIFNPPEGIINTYLSPRSAMMASHVLYGREQVGARATLASLIGAIGETAAMELNAFIQLNDKLPTWEAILADPTGIELHDDPMAEIITTYKAVNQVTAQTMPKWLKYLTRLSKEKQGLFAKSLSASDNSKSMACKEFIDWATTNNYLFKKAV